MTNGMPRAMTKQLKIKYTIRKAEKNIQKYLKITIRITKD